MTTQIATQMNGVNVDQLVATVNAIQEHLEIARFQFRWAFLGLSQDVRPGLENIRLTYLVKSDVPREKIEALCDYVESTSRVLDIIRNPVPVTVALVD